MHWCRITHALSAALSIVNQSTRHGQRQGSEFQHYFTCKVVLTITSSSSATARPGRRADTNPGRPYRAWWCGVLTRMAAIKLLPVRSTKCEQLAPSANMPTTNRRNLVATSNAYRLYSTLCFRVLKKHRELSAQTQSRWLRLLRWSTQSFGQLLHDSEASMPRYGLRSLLITTAIFALARWY